MGPFGVSEIDGVGPGTREHLLSRDPCGNLSLLAYLKQLCGRVRGVSAPAASRRTASPQFRCHSSTSSPVSGVRGGVPPRLREGCRDRIAQGLGFLFSTLRSLRQGPAASLAKGRRPLSLLLGESSLPGAEGSLLGPRPPPAGGPGPPRASAPPSFQRPWSAPRQSGGSGPGAPASRGPWRSCHSAAQLILFVTCLPPVSVSAPGQGPDPHAVGTGDPGRLCPAPLFLEAAARTVPGPRRPVQPARPVPGDTHRPPAWGAPRPGRPGPLRSPRGPPTTPHPVSP